VLFQAVLNPPDNLPLPLCAQRFGRNQVRIMRTPIADADLGVLADHLLKGHRCPRRCVERRVTPAADKGLLSISGHGFHRQGHYPPNGAPVVFWVQDE
jgi:hypothetical protein